MCQVHSKNWCQVLCVPKFDAELINFDSQFAQLMSSLYLGMVLIYLHFESRFHCLNLQWSIQNYELHFHALTQMI